MCTLKSCRKFELEDKYNVSENSSKDKSNVSENSTRACAASAIKIQFSLLQRNWCCFIKIYFIE
jgi:hypothetical protein